MVSDLSVSSRVRPQGPGGRVGGVAGLDVVVDHGNTDHRQALGTIEVTARQGLVEMRRLLGVLRSAERSDVGRRLEEDAESGAPAELLAGAANLSDRIARDRRPSSARCWARRWASSSSS